MKMLVNYVLRKVYQLLWFFLHFLYSWQFKIRETLRTNLRKIIKRLSSCLPTYSYYGELATLTKSAEKLQKVPKHIAFSIIENTRSRGHHDEPIDFQMLARVISWAWVARIPVVSVHDYHGRIKASYRELACYIQEELIQNYWALKKHGRGNDPPTSNIKFHNVPKINGYSNGGLSNGSNGVTSSNNPLHIVVFSNEDGKAGIIRATKEIYFEHLSNNNKTLSSSSLKEADHNNDDEEEDNDDEPKKCSVDVVKNINESTIDSILNRVFSWPNSIAASPEPDVLVILGNIQSTLGFLPWHIRLTEIHWLPKLELVETKDFLQVLKNFSRCQQRVGT